MSFSRLLFWGRVYVAGLFFTSFALYAFLHLNRRQSPRASIVSVWQAARRTARAVVVKDPESTLSAESRREGATRTIDDVLDQGPVLSTQAVLFGMSFVPGRDGIEASYEGKSAYATPDDLLKLGAYELSIPFGEFKIKFGVDARAAQAHLARELGVSPEQLLARGRFRRLALSRRDLTPAQQIWDPTPTTLRSSVLAAGAYLAHAVRRDGTFRYEVDGATATDSPDYNIPRHAGAAWYLSQVAAYSHDRQLQAAARQSVRYLVEHQLADCGKNRCIADGPVADLGSSALALLALVELVESGIAPEFQSTVGELAAFLRSQQRRDGEFQHLYDRTEQHPIDVQFLYYSGEAAFALGRAQRVTADRRDLVAARDALHFQVEKPFWYIGWRYYWAAEHWTCHALDELWDRAPSQAALRYCLAWQDWVRNTAVFGREAAREYDFAATSGPFLPPQIIVSASRMEAAVATLSAARAARLPASEIEPLEAGIRGTLAFMMRFQFVPGPAHLMPDPEAMYGGFPTSETDLRVRIDTPQHAGTGLLAYLKLLSASAKQERPN